MTALKVMATIPASRIPEMRRAAHLTQREVARRLGVSHTDLCKVEAALRPGGLLDRMTAVVLEVATAAFPQD